MKEGRPAMPPGTLAVLRRIHQRLRSFLARRCWVHWVPMHGRSVSVSATTSLGVRAKAAPRGWRTLETAAPRQAPVIALCDCADPAELRRCVPSGVRSAWSPLRPATANGNAKLLAFLSQLLMTDWSSQGSNGFWTNDLPRARSLLRGALPDDDKFSDICAAKVRLMLLLGI